MVLIVITGLVFTALWHPRTKNGVLAYATSMGSSALLQNTNARRAENGAGVLTINSALSAAAQTKANDMAARNYWAHNTPDGNPPWYFIENAGYSYQKAGENLAYGFDTSADTIAGWMNSPSHRENMLDPGYVDVGFGFINVPDFVGTGNETIVVAEYGTPLAGGTAAGPVVAESIPPAPQPVPQPKVAAVQQSAPAPVPAPTPAPEPAPTPQVVINAAPSDTLTPVQKAQVVSTATKNPIDPKPVKVSRLAALTGGKIVWLASAVTISLVASGAILILRHTYAIHKWLIRGERYVLHHVVFDMTIISLIGLLTIVSQTAGVIR